MATAPACLNAATPRSSARGRSGGALRPAAVFLRARVLLHGAAMPLRTAVFAVTVLVATGCCGGLQTYLPDGGLAGVGGGSGDGVGGGTASGTGGGTASGTGGGTA